jgi:hypothetical protein
MHSLLKILAETLFMGVIFYAFVFHWMILVFTGIVDASPESVIVLRNFMFTLSCAGSFVFAVIREGKEQDRLKAQKIKDDEADWQAKILNNRYNK